MPHSPDDLPEGYMLERDFIGWREKEDGEIEELIRVVGSPREEIVERMERRGDEGGTDAEKLLAVLKRDLSGV